MRKLARQVKKLQKQSEHNSSMNAGDTIEVDYFALQDLIQYFVETREAARRVIVARDALHQVMFSLSKEDHT